MTGLPIRFQEHIQLTTLGIQKASISFTTLTLQSEKGICICESIDGRREVVIIDLSNPSALMRRPISAEAAILHPTQNIIALRAEKQLQIFHLELKTKLKAYVMEEEVQFWTWANEQMIGLVTKSSVYHWPLQPDTQPIKVFERHTSMADTQIINYHINKNEKWSVLIGISSREGRIVGSMQLFSKERNISQFIEGHAAAFATLKTEEGLPEYKLFVFAVRTSVASKLHIAEIDHQPGNPAFQKKNIDIFFPPEAVNDFPVAIQISRKYSVIYLVTKYGFIHIYDLEMGTCIYMNRISSETIFVTTEYENGNSLLGINRKGQVLSVSIDESNIIPYILNNLNDISLAIKMATRGNLPGAEDLYKQQFDNLFSAGNYQDAAKLAANSPLGFLRTPQTIEQFKRISVEPGQLSPIMQYFGILLDKGSLNNYETIELIKPVLAQNRENLLEKWLQENKLECSEELGDIVRPHNIKTALSIYVKGNVPSKVVQCLIDIGQFEKIVPYINKVGYSANYGAIFQQIIQINIEKGIEFATQIANSKNITSADIEKITDIFLSRNMIQQATAFLLDALKDNEPEHGHLQTRLLETNLINAPQVADAILGNEMFSYYDKSIIATLCEKAGLYQRALEHYDQINDIKRVIRNIHDINPEWLINYFKKIDTEVSFEYLGELLNINNKQSFQIVLQICIKYSDKLGPSRIINLFEQHKIEEGLYYYLGSIINTTESPDVVFKYIQIACQIGQLKEVERICRENNHLNGEKVKNFLKEAKLPDQLPLIIICDRFNFIYDLILYLYQNRYFKSIETYVQKINPSRAPAIIGGLLDVDCEEQFITNLLSTVSNQISIDELIEEVEKRNRLKMLHPFLESAFEMGNQNPSIFNALAKIYIDTNNYPNKFLQENNLYDTLVIGKYCEKRDPYLAFLAYKKGQNDYELIRTTSENSMFKEQARYLLRRKNETLWNYVLNNNNSYRQSLIDQVISIAVPESNSPEEVSIVVKSFMNAGLSSELVDLLEKIILEPTIFSDNQNLQNLLILTAIKADKTRVNDYINKLKNYDVNDVAAIILENHLYEEAFEIYKKHKNHIEAVNVLIEHIVSIDRAAEYAESVDIKEIWSKLAKAQLDGYRIKDSINSYIKASDPDNFHEVIEVASKAEKYNDLIRYLEMARQNIRESVIDTELLFSYAHVKRINAVEYMLQGANSADILSVGNRCYNEGNYQAAKLMFSSISNWARLASTLVYLGEYQNAIDCARKANSIKVWKHVNDACIEQKEFRLAQICGLNLIIHADEMHDVIAKYERKGYFDEIISLLEVGLSLERATRNLFTELAILYVKYRPDAVLEHLKLFWSRLHIPKVVKICEEVHLWSEAAFLYMHYDEYDNSALIMIEHSHSWNHDIFKDVLIKVSNTEIIYKALEFYYEQQPLLLADLLSVVISRVDHSRVVKMFEKLNSIPIIANYLRNVQPKNIEAVNNAINNMFIEEEDYKSLKDSIDNFDKFDPIKLAKQLEKHELLEFRRISAYLFRKNKKWKHSIDLSIADKFYSDAIETASQSKETDIIKDLLKYFQDIGANDCFIAMLYAGYDLLPAHYVLELTWRSGLINITMPFFINFIYEQDQKIKNLQKVIEKFELNNSNFKNDLTLTTGLSNRLILDAPDHNLQQSSDLGSF
ncbi:hypothetical protein T552_00051 [Pneumocystis carinii B80]|uniref:Clathrin heavy chain n=1 Tax=Pneumocystis carinii (strain B80) TaxID=1408658 RepID=A0A0W4ZSQ8_PNEC8|nr:hypothetical protein T552_00051 [Pneumocystis carinii B80]KTW31407.1 hypothetical protein T552_00051 [Pneumocystis carinii B80]